MVIAFFYNSGILALYADEPTRALVSLEMTLNGDWMPTINNVVYINKPPLYNWILIPFLSVLGYEEWVVRLPAILSLILLGYFVYRSYFKISGSRDVAFFTAMAFLTSGNLLFYSSLLGHIDATFSIFIFVLFTISYRYGSQGKWKQLFRWTYILCFIGFMLKGLPAIVFGGVTLLTTTIFFKQPRKLVSTANFANALWFIIPTVTYFYLFSLHYPLDEYILNLWSESSKRTVVDKSPISSILHLFTFPGQFIVDTAPWSFFGLIFLSKKYRQFVKQNTFLRFTFRLLLANILVYWLSPDTRARYIMMMYPLFFVIIIWTLIRFRANFKSLWTGISWFTILLPIGISVLFIMGHSLAIKYKWELVTVLTLSIGVVILALTSKNKSLFPLLFFMLVSRLGFDLIALPERVEVADSTREKKEAFEIAEITGSEPLATYCSGVHHVTSYYITTKTGQVVSSACEDAIWNPKSFYLIPADFNFDPDHTKVYYNFTRRHGNKPFILAKFEKGFPKDK